MHILEIQNRLVSINMSTFLRPIFVVLLLALLPALASCERQSEAKKVVTAPPVPVILRPHTR